MSNLIVVYSEFDVMTDWPGIKKGVRPSSTAEVQLPQGTVRISEHTPFQFGLAQAESEISWADVFDDGSSEPCGFEVNLSRVSDSCHFDISTVGVHDVRAAIFIDGQCTIDERFFCA